MPKLRSVWLVAVPLVFACMQQSVEEVAPSIAAPLSMINGSFDANSLTGWTTTMYSNTGLGTTTPVQFSDLDLGSGDGTLLTQVVSGAQASVVPAGLSTSATLRAPLFGSTCAVINEQGKNNHASALRQSFVVSPSDFDPTDGKVHLRFARAAVLQSPNHAANQLPYFFVTMTNASRANALIYDEFHYANDGTATWQTDPATTGVLYTDWQLSDILVSPLQASIGDQLDLSVIAAGCGAGGHFGELYVDGFAKWIPGVTIDSFGPNIIVPNTDVAYTFDVYNHGSVSAANVTFSVPMPAGTTFVSLQTPAGVSCTNPNVGANGTSQCTLGTLLPGQLLSLTLTVFVPASYASSTVALTNQGVASSTQPVLRGTTLQAQIVGNAALADLSTTIAPIPAQCCDQNLGFAVTFANDGPTAVTSVPVEAVFSTAPEAQAYRCTASAGASCGGQSVISGTGALNTNVNLAVGSQLSCVILGTFSAQTPNWITLTGNIGIPAGISDAYPNNNAQSSYLQVMGQPVCAQALPNGHACTQASACLSGQCVDGVCCNTSCTAQCMACDNAASLGSCSAVVGEAPHGSRPGCGGFVCDAGSCQTACSADSQCASDFLCELGVCITKARCVHDTDCPGGTFCTPLSTCEAPRQQRDGEPNWVVQGMGSTSMGCQQHGAPGPWAVGLMLAFILVRHGRKRGAKRGAKCAPLLLWVLVIGVQAALPLRQAHADDSLSVTASHFQLWGGDEDIWATQSASIPPHLRWGFFAFGNVAHNLVRVVSTQSHSAERSLIRYQETLDVGVTLALARWVELSLAESVVWQQVSTAPFLSAQLAQPAQTFAAGDLRFAPKLRLIDKERLRLAVTLAATFPTGRRNSFVGNHTVTYTPKVLLDIGRRAGLRLLLNAGVLIRNKRALASSTLHDAFVYGVAGAAPFYIRALPAEALLSAVGEVGLQSTHEVDNPLEGHIGLRIWPADELALDLGGGTGFTNGLGAPRWRVFLGLKGSFGRHREAPIADRDGDGIPDDVDACPDEPGVASADPNLHGCPLPAPVQPQAPTSAPIAPPEPNVVVGREPLVAIAGSLLFDAGQARLSSEDMSLLDKVDAALSEHPEARISIDGHTDSSGSPAQNMRLSKERAELAYRWLVSHGIAADRLEPRHFGSTLPLASNKTAKGRRQNRRVEFHLLKARMHVPRHGPAGISMPPGLPQKAGAPG